MRWLSDNKDRLRGLAGQWIAVEGSELVASSREFAQVLLETRTRGIAVPFILFVSEPSQDSMVGI
jgi:hypothetical protein